MNTSEPIIVLGMHRSGTTMIVNVLEHLDVFMGHDKELNGESRFFLKLNDWLMKQGSSSWDDPRSLEFLHKDERIKGLLLKYLRFYVDSLLKIKFFGLRRYFRNSEVGCNWGWKDPRNTYTLKFWLDLFPNAKFILVERSGIDVAKSLVVRRDKYLSRSIDRFKYRKYYHLFRPAREPFGTTGLIQNIDDGVDLWYEYLKEGREICKNYPEQCFLIRYETFLNEPRTVISEMCAHLGLEVESVGESAIENIVSSLDVTRANAISVRDYKLKKSTLEKLSFYES